MLTVTALGFTTWQLFACMRLAWWGTATDLSDIQTCQDVQSKALETQCHDAREQDWSSYCGSLYYSGFAIDCDNPNQQEANAIKNRLAQSAQSEQWKCSHAS